MPTSTTCLENAPRVRLLTSAWLVGAAARGWQRSKVPCGEVRVNAARSPARKSLEDFDWARVKAFERN